jgi:hypothetical protein
VFYNAKPVLNFIIEFFVEDCDGDFDDEETNYTFSNFVSGYFRVYNERGGRLIKNLPMTNISSTLVLNSNDTTFEDNGNYYYEIGYLMTGGYELALMYGRLKVV